MTDGNITIGRFGQVGTTSIESLLKVNNIASTDPAGGSINIGADQVGGQISLGLLSTRTGDINIGNNMFAGLIKIGSFFGATSTAGIEIGTANKGIVNVRGSAANICTDGGTVVVGDTTNTSTTTNGGIIKQITPLVNSGGNVEVVIGNADNISSYSTTFNKKVSQPLVPINCYQITASGLFSAQYFEIVVSGSNGGFGGFTYKGCFGLQQQDTGSLTFSSVNTLFSYGGLTTNQPPIIGLSVAGTVVTLSVDASYSSSNNQNFITTLISYPSITSSNLKDYIITAI
jgi:hypothetical protein